MELSLKIAFAFMVLHFASLGCCGVYLREENDILNQKVLESSDDGYVYEDDCIYDELSEENEEESESASEEDKQLLDILNKLG